MTLALFGKDSKGVGEMVRVVKIGVEVVCGELAVVVVVVNVEGGRGDLTDSYLCVFWGCGQQGMMD